MNVGRRLPPRILRATISNTLATMMKDLLTITTLVLACCSAAPVARTSSDDSNIADGDRQSNHEDAAALSIMPTASCSPSSRFYSFRGESRFSDCPSYAVGARPRVQVNFRSYNNDAYFIKIEVCATGSSSNCVSSYRTKYSGSGGAHTVSHTVSDRGYSRPYVKISFECDNWIESCQIDMTGAGQYE